MTRTGSTTSMVVSRSAWARYPGALHQVRLADPSRDLGADGRVVQVLAGAIRRTPGILDRRTGLRISRLGIVDVALRHGMLGEQRFETIEGASGVVEP